MTKSICQCHVGRVSSMGCALSAGCGVTNLRGDKYAGCGVTQFAGCGRLKKLRGAGG